MTIDVDTATAYLKADGDDEDLITSMIANAQSICEGYCNRVFYDTDAAAATDFALALTDRTDALAARKTQLASVTGMSQDAVETRALITDHYIGVFARIKQRVNGIVWDGMIEAAVLMTLGHLYVNREDNLATGNNVVQVPVGAQRILQPKLWIGDLADNVAGDECWEDFNPDCAS